jgi:hypothetical protein
VHVALAAPRVDVVVDRDVEGVERGDVPAREAEQRAQERNVQLVPAG